MKTLSVIIAVMLCSNAAFAGSKTPALPPGDYGEFPSKYREIVDAHIHKYFFDPYSIRDFKIDPPVKDMLKKGWLAGGGKRLGYSVAVSFNAKNQFGAYTGIHAYLMFIRNGKVISYCDLTEPSAIGPIWIDTP